VSDDLDFLLDARIVQAEIDEKSKDLAAFLQAREIIRMRVLEVKDSPSVFTPLPTWSGTDAVLGSLDLSIHAMERTLGELHECLKKAKPRFRVIEGGEPNEDR
jgi:hypothetical protein